MFRIKICGITTVKDAQLAALAGADAIGLNFYDKSPRCVDLATAEQIGQAVSGKLIKVGVFVNAPVDEILQIADRVGLDHLQLHGDEAPDFLRGLAGRAVVRAFRCAQNGFAEIERYLRECRQAAQPLSAVLLDAHSADQYGGTGNVVDWQAVLENRQIFGDTPLILAGGLTPFNVAEAIATARPQAVDVASGVESEPGKKDLLLVRAFCNTAKKALDELAA